ncbi:MAG: hypothetical protein PF508_02265 [Spirochaeta sp.]|jgi:hypothetical protein|nr:hypothetical protein [Spirochaeta sp.]
MVGNLDVLSRKAGFNTALRHFRATTSFLKPVESGVNLADLLTEALENGTVTRTQLRPIVSALLPDKYGYHARSHNVEAMIETPEQIIEVLSAWTALQIVIAYEHPQAGLFIINPMNPESWEPALPILKDELLVVYVGSVPGAEISTASLEKAGEDVHAVLAGEKPRGRKEYVLPEGTAAPAPRKPAPKQPTASTAAAAASTGKRRITPRYSVVVTNELFHNGNVEAWKRIIASFRSSYPDLEVLIWYDNERINDINALFKWGKVKHGTPIMFSVAGTEIKDVSKLQRYLFEGASPRFEMFLKGGIDQPLELF